MNIQDIVNFAKSIENDINKKKLRISDKNIPKAGAYAGMIVKRGDILIQDTVRMQRYMDDIQDGLTRLQSYGIKLPPEEVKNEQTK